MIEREDFTTNNTIMVVAFLIQILTRERKCDHSRFKNTFHHCLFLLLLLAFLFLLKLPKQFSQKWQQIAVLQKCTNHFCQFLCIVICVRKLYYTENIWALLARSTTTKEQKSTQICSKWNATQCEHLVCVAKVFVCMEANFGYYKIL